MFGNTEVKKLTVFISFCFWAELSQMGFIKELKNLVATVPLKVKKTVTWFGNVWSLVELLLELLLPEWFNIYCMYEYMHKNEHRGYFVVTALFRFIGV